jgi:hypothetical protein
MGLAIISFTEVHHKIPVDAYVEETQEASLSHLSSTLRTSGHFQGCEGLREAWIMLRKRGGHCVNSSDTQMKYEFVVRVRSRLRAIMEEIKTGSLLYVPFIQRQSLVQPLDEWSAAAKVVPDSLWLPPTKKSILTAIMRSLYTLMREASAFEFAPREETDNKASSSSCHQGVLHRASLQNLTQIHVTTWNPMECDDIFVRQQMGSHNVTEAVQGAQHPSGDPILNLILMQLEHRESSSFTGKK